MLIILFCKINSLNGKINDLTDELNEAKDKIESLDNDCEQFNNMHADHYAFEEYKVLELINSDKANTYKQFLDSIKTK